MRALVLIALGVALGGCYGRATPESCYKKYVTNKRGDHYRDTYEACLARAKAREEGLPDELAQLREVVAFETGCSNVMLKPLEFAGKVVTLVGANACGMRRMYRRGLRRHMGVRTHKGMWVLVASDEPPMLAPAREDTGRSSGQPRQASDNPYDL